VIQHLSDDYDPTEVTLQVKAPSGDVATYTYTDEQITRDSEGHFSISLALKKAGRWLYRFTATGTYRGTTGDVLINVDPSEFASV